jgi:hypothetical protein
MQEKRPNAVWTKASRVRAELKRIVERKLAQFEKEQQHGN